MAGALPMSCVPVRVDTPASVGLRQLQRRGDDAAQDAEIQRLRDEIERAELERAHRGLDVAVRGDHGAGNAGAVRAHPLEQIEAVAVGQPHVGEAQIEALRLEQLLRARDVARRLRGELHARQRQRDELDQIGLIIDDQYQRWRHALGPSGPQATQRSGSRNTMRNRLPPLVRGS